ncbi:TPA: helix-turn-helix transcriptional regulator [Burkholderia cenocepacia]|nr:helix-turn-helix transcriptional regulator [Burkholderia cenocepacia]
MSNFSKASLIGRRIKERRQALKWSQAKLAEYAGVSQGTIGHIESGRNQTATTLPLIARGLGVTVEWLTRDDADQPPAIAPSPTETPLHYWPFTVTPGQVKSLSERDLARADGFLMALVEKSGAARRKA